MIMPRTAQTDGLGDLRVLVQIGRKLEQLGDSTVEHLFHSQSFACPDSIEFIENCDHCYDHSKRPKEMRLVSIRWFRRQARSCIDLTTIRLCTRPQLEIIVLMIV